MEDAQYQYVIAKRQKVAVSKTPIFEPFSSHFSVRFQLKPKNDVDGSKGTR